MSLWSVYWVFKQLTGKEGHGPWRFQLLAALGAWTGLAGVLPAILLSSLGGGDRAAICWPGPRQGHPDPVRPYLAVAGWISFMGARIWWRLTCAFAGLG